MYRDKRRMFSEGRFIKFILFFIAGVLFFGFVVMGLWNAILPAVIHVSKISFIQAIGILLLSKILFGGFHGGWRGRANRRWRIQEKLESMTPEEQEKFKSELRNRCGRWGSRSNQSQSGEGSAE